MTGVQTCALPIYFVRPEVVGNDAVEPWYRYNVMFFAHDSVIGELPAKVVARRVPDDAGIRDYSPMGYRLREPETPAFFPRTFSPRG